MIMAKQPEPEIRRTREWSITWPRPRVGGWPNIVTYRPGTARQQTYGIAPRLLRVRVRLMSDGEMTVDTIEIRGKWLSSGADSSWRRLTTGPVPTTYTWAVAPDWARELSAASVERASAELAADSAEGERARIVAGLRKLAAGDETIEYAAGVIEDGELPAV
jgi:hypothetical protein